MAATGGERQAAPDGVAAALSSVNSGGERCPAPLGSAGSGGMAATRAPRWLPVARICRCGGGPHPSAVPDPAAWRRSPLGNVDLAVGPSARGAMRQRQSAWRWSRAPRRQAVAQNRWCGGGPRPSTASGGPRPSVAPDPVAWRRSPLGSTDLAVGPPAGAATRIQRRGDDHRCGDGATLLGGERRRGSRCLFMFDCLLLMFIHV